MTLRLRVGIPSLREADLFAGVLIAITASAFGLFFRIVEFSVQKTHLHLIVEATDSISLTAGVRALGVRIASRINAHLGRKGPVFAERFHVHVIESPREARLAYLYVLGNSRKHATEAEIALPDDWIDPRSSGPWFRGWMDANPALLRTDPKPVAHARTWLLSVGWRKYHRLIAVREMPAAAKPKGRRKSRASGQTDFQGSAESSWVGASRYG